MIRIRCGLCAALGWAERKQRSGSRGGEAEKRKQGRKRSRESRREEAAERRGRSEERTDQATNPKASHLAPRGAPTACSSDLDNAGREAMPTCGNPHTAATTHRGLVGFHGTATPISSLRSRPRFRQLRQLFPSTAHWPGALARTHDPTRDERSRAERSVQHEQIHISRLHSSIFYLSYSAPSPFPPASLLPKPALAFAHVPMHVPIHVLG
jgi:hypothetical protein